MTEKQIEKMKKYVELIRWASRYAGEEAGKYHVGAISFREYWKSVPRHEMLCDYLILRMEREMKR